MRKAPNDHRVYRALLRLYPKAHRHEYGELMVQTFDDLLSENTGAGHAAAIWLRVVGELPSNIVQEHIHNLEGKKMSDFRPNKRMVITTSAVVVSLVGLGVGIVLATRPDKPFVGTYFARVQKPAHKPACITRTRHNAALGVSDKEEGFVAQAVAGSIWDVPAGNTVDAYIQTYEPKKAVGTAVYSGKYGTYNFVAERAKVDTNDTYTAGWRITKFEACKN